MERQEANPYEAPRFHSDRPFDSSPIRRLVAVALLVLFVVAILANTRGPIVSDGVLFFAPIVVCAVAFWLFSHFRKSRSLLVGSATGIYGGIVGHVAWLATMAVLNRLPNLTDLIWLTAISVVVAAVVGGTFGLVLTVGFRRRNNNCNSDEQG